MRCGSALAQYGEHTGRNRERDPCKVPYNSPTVEPVSEQANRDRTASTPFPVDDWVRVGATVRTIREVRGMSPQQLASCMGISGGYLANIEAGRKKLTNVMLARAADALGVTQVSIMLPQPAKQNRKGRAA